MIAANDGHRMAVAPDPAEIFHRAVEEGERRLGQSMLELVSTSFIAGFTIVFGLAALGIVEAAFEPQFHNLAPVAGALAFGVGLVFLIVGRTELFNENFFDPVAKAVEQSGSWRLWGLLRLWVVTFAFNLVGGALFAFILSVDGVLPPRAVGVLTETAEEIAHRGTTAGFGKAVAGGTLVALLSFFLEAVNSVGSRIAMAYIVGVLLTLGPFSHVIVTVLHLLFGLFFGAAIGLETLATTTAVVTAGNFVGGLGLVTLSHVAQAEGADESDG